MVTPCHPTSASFITTHISQTLPLSPTVPIFLSLLFPLISVTPSIPHNKPSLCFKQTQCLHSNVFPFYAPPLGLLILEHLDFAGGCPFTTTMLPPAGVAGAQEWQLPPEHFSCVPDKKRLEHAENSGTSLFLLPREEPHFKTLKGICNIPK